LSCKIDSIEKRKKERYLLLVLKNKKNVKKSVKKQRLRYKLMLCACNETNVNASFISKGSFEFSREKRNKRLLPTLLFPERECSSVTRALERPNRTS